jgi:hypothetical protein
MHHINQPNIFLDSEFNNAHRDYFNKKKIIVKKYYALGSDL